MRALLVAVVLVAAAAPLGAGSTSLVTDLVLTVDGETATGRIAEPEGPASAVVVLLHGYTHTSASHVGHLQHLAEQGYAAVAMDFRGSGFPLRAGASDSVAATDHVTARHPGVPVVLYSVSMGTAVASMVLAERPVFSYWVNNEGLSMLGETWAEASALAPANGFAAQAKADIEAECAGGVPDAPHCYAERSAALRAAEYAYLDGVVATHGLNDGIVPYDQGREMASALRAAGVPTDFHTVARCPAGGEGTTVTGYTPLGTLGLAGHGSEANDAHCLTAISFALLDDVLAGTLVPADRELVVDG